MDLFLIYVAILCNAISIRYKIEELGVELLSILEIGTGFKTSFEDRYRLFKGIQKTVLVLFFVIGLLTILLPPLIVLTITSVLLFLMTVFM